MSFHPTMDYDAGHHRSLRQQPTDDGRPFEYTPENRARFEEIARRRRLLKTADAHSPSVSTTMIAFSLGSFALLYGALAVVDVVLMRRYARVDPPEVGGEDDEFAVPAVSY